MPAGRTGGGMPAGPMRGYRLHGCSPRCRKVIRIPSGSRAGEAGEGLG